MKIYQLVIMMFALTFGVLAPSAYAEQPKAEAVVLASININTASAETLASELKGVGKSKAQAIVAYRNQHGPYKTIGEITDVKGIGKGILERNVGRIVVK